jgi:alpha-ketoglutarate-dependent taurine dioxygenase
MTTNNFTVQNLDKSFGAIITDIKLSDITNKQASDLYKVWLDRSLLIFPDQHLSNEEQVRFAENFGELEFDLSPISNVRTDGTIRNATDDDIVKSLRGNMEWHHDSTYMPVQAKGAVFTAHVVPSKDGQTGWSDMTAAYDALSPEMKDKIENLSAYHSYEYSQKERFGHKSKEESEFNSYGFDVDPKPLRPLVKVHPETGKKTLTIGRHIHKIPGLSDEAAVALARELEELACQEKRMYHHSWSVGDAVIWDNRCLMHQACPWDLSEARTMYHARLQGDKVTESALNYLEN